MNSVKKEKYTYLASNLGRGLLWLAVIVGLFLVIKYQFDDWYLPLMDSMVNQPILVFTTFTFSEIIFGIFPPELFMLWAVHQDSVSLYIFYTFLFGLISYSAGIIGYFIGLQFSLTPLYKRLTAKFIGDLEKNVLKYGGFMIFIAAVTPVPFTAICMVTGTTQYNFYKFLLISMSRILRFAVYGYAIWEVNQI